MAYFLMLFAFLGVVVLAVKDLLPIAHRNTLVVLACLSLLAHFVFQVTIEANKKTDLIRHYH